ncbi:CoA ester lyase [Rhodovulum sulfidophilum]|uniref:HpcH/HpaI aldolase/citrate lyase family protein n=1 Tax=Rhodovulum sulfidophilum TaxID=35806 RepID=UPI0019115471|nr:CoA ester lyase [Rhodovulum sulfidophilum]MBK5922860.1 CoA ester lyase [Rhodovulum sulfidophilum]
MRSWLFVPGNRPDRIAKARGLSADVLILDLEDSVVIFEKAAARSCVLEALREPRGANRLWVRVNPLETSDFEADLDTALAGGADGIVLPKAESGACIRALGAACAARGQACPPVLAIATETARAIFGLGSYAGLSSSLAGLTWGAEDLSAALGSARSRGEDGTLTGPYALARNLTLFGAVAAEVQPVDTVWTDIRDLAGLEAECLEAVRDGFTGKMAIHPAQVPIINRCFRPSEEEIEVARRIVEAFAAAPTAGVVAIDGEMIDMPHLKRSRLILQRAGEAT